MYTTPKERWTRRAIATVSLLVSGFVAAHIMPCLLGMIVATVFLGMLATWGMAIVLAAVDPGRAPAYIDALGGMTGRSLTGILRIAALLLAGTLRQLDLGALPNDLRLLLAAIEARTGRVHVLSAPRRLRGRNDDEDDV